MIIIFGRVVAGVAGRAAEALLLGARAKKIVAFEYRKICMT